MKPSTFHLALILLSFAYHGCHSLEHSWSVCSYSLNFDCKNGMASDDCTFQHLEPVFVSVKGLFVFFVEGREGQPTGLAEFVFQERVGNYTLLTETATRISCLKQMGMGDHRIPAISVVNELSLISDGTARYSESVGSLDSCQLSPQVIKSLAINEAERWELVASNGTSVCIQVEDTFSMIPGIGRDTRALGLSHEPNSVCAIIRGCSKSPNEVIKIPNHETQGVLRI